MGRLELAPLCRQNARPQVGTLHCALSSELPLSQLPQKAERRISLLPLPCYFMGGEVSWFKSPQSQGSSRQGCDCQPSVLLTEHCPSVMKGRVHTLEVRFVIKGQLKTVDDTWSLPSSPLIQGLLWHSLGWNLICS